MTEQSTPVTETAPTAAVASTAPSAPASEPAATAFEPPSSEPAATEPEPAATEPEPAAAGSEPEPDTASAPTSEPADPQQFQVPPLPVHAPTVHVVPPVAADLGPQVPARPHRALRAVARWTAAVAVLGVVGAGTAYGISSADRADVPGLATASDGRWDYPKLSLPALPAGRPRPFNASNTADVHYADLRGLLLPAPAGAVPDKKLTGGWVSTDRYVAEYIPEQRADLRLALRDYAVRHIAARGWTMPDGTTTRIYLLQFQAVSFAQSFQDDELSPLTSAGTPLVTAPETVLDDMWDGAGEVPDTLASAYQEPKPYGATQTRQAYIMAGDTLALVVQERKGGAPAVPFHQTLILQNQLLG